MSHWRRELKGFMRALGKASTSGGKGKAERIKNAANRYIIKAKALYSKLEKDMPKFPINTMAGLKLMISLEHYHTLLKKHIDLVYRRIIKGETIPHEEKMFSIFETYTEASWSFDKVFWRKENKELLQLEVPQVIMPKLEKSKKSILKSLNY